MREATRGYLAAVLEDAGTDAAGGLAAEVGSVSSFVAASPELRQAFEDAALDSGLRRLIAEQLLEARLSADGLAVVLFAIQAEPSSEVIRSLDSVAQRLEAEAQHRPGDPALDPPVGRSALRERVEGYMLRRLATASASELEEIEDGIFRLARVIESTPELREVLSDPEVDPEAKAAVARQLLEGKLSPAGISVVCYVARSARGRELVATLDTAVERVAAEQGRRVAEVQVATALDEDTAAQLRGALSRLVDREVELRTTQAPEILGGMVVLVGDVMVDASLRKRLAQLREAMLQGKVEVPGGSGGSTESGGTGEPENHG